MLRIILHIERLLLMHDCVIVPGFGGFISQSVPSNWDKGKNLLIPPKKEIGFNETLHHSDGLLVESYMQQYNIDYNEAQKMLEEDVEEIKNKLRQENRLSVGLLGAISLEAEGQLLFTPSDTDVFSVHSYGLTDLNLLPFSDLLQEDKKEISLDNHPHLENKDTLYIPVSRKFIRFVISTAAAIAMFLLISTPISDVKKESYQASFIPYEVVKPAAEKTLPKEASFQEAEPVQPIRETIIPVASTSTSNVEMAKEKTVESKEATAPAVQPASTSNQKMYHAIIASFPNQKQADEFLKTIDHEKFASANIVVRSNKYRVYAQRFTNRQEADEYIKTLRTDVKYKDTWLFVCR